MKLCASCPFVLSDRMGSIHPQGWVPIETIQYAFGGDARCRVAFTPKGGCPLKLGVISGHTCPYLTRSIHPQGWVPIETSADEELSPPLIVYGSIHPQGWVPIETSPRDAPTSGVVASVAFTPKGGCPLKLYESICRLFVAVAIVAFTPKGGCPLKRVRAGSIFWSENCCSIHP